MKNFIIDNNAKLFKALGNVRRLQILFSLVGRELNVGELEKIIGLSQSALSQHLAILRSENIVKTRREAQTIFYSIRNDKVIKILNLLEKIG